MVSLRRRLVSTTTPLSCRLKSLKMFQTRGGRESLVAICVPKGAEYDGWERAAITPFSVREQQIAGTGWTLREASGVAPDDIVMLNDFSSEEERVAAIVSHLVARQDEFMSFDDMDACVCTDPRIAIVADRLARVGSMARNPGSIEISGIDVAAREHCVDSVTLRLDDGRSIDVNLEAERVQIAIASPSDLREFTISGMHVFDEAMSPIEEQFVPTATAPADLSY